MPRSVNSAASKARRKRIFKTSQRLLWQTEERSYSCQERS